MPVPDALQPAETGVTDGLSWALFRPSEQAAGGVVILHGAGSRKENHADFAEVCAEHGLAALTFDARGHGASDGAMDAGAFADVATMAGVLRERAGVQAIGLRGSSMGGYFAITAAAEAGAAAVVAICPASARGLAASIRHGLLGFRAELDSLPAALEARSVRPALQALDPDRVLLQHAEGDEVVPVVVSRTLAERAPGVHLDVVPGGDHRSVQHDPAAQERAARFLAARVGA